MTQEVLEAKALERVEKAGEDKPGIMARPSGQDRRRHLAVGDIVVDAPGVEALALAMPCHVADRPAPFQFVHDKIAFGVRIVVGRVRHLEGERKRRICRFATP